MHSKQSSYSLYIPRTRNIINQEGLELNTNVKVIEPLGYFEMLELEERCKYIITDSGGVQKEAYFMKKPCITLRDQTEWVETVESGWNTLAGSKKEKIIHIYNSLSQPVKYPAYYGAGNAGLKFLETF